MTDMDQVPEALEAQAFRYIKEAGSYCPALFGAGNGEAAHLTCDIVPEGIRVRAKSKSLENVHIVPWMQMEQGDINPLLITIRTVEREMEWHDG